MAFSKKILTKHSFKCKSQNGRGASAGVCDQNATKRHEIDSECLALLQAEPSGFSGHSAAKYIQAAKRTAVPVLFETYKVLSQNRRVAASMRV